MNFILGWSEKNGSLRKSQSFLLTHAQMFSLIWFHFKCCLHDILSPEMKFRFCQNDCSEITPSPSFNSGCIMWTLERDWPDTEMKIFHFAQNEIPCKHPLKLQSIGYFNKLRSQTYLVLFILFIIKINWDLLHK